jgi:hemerythrin-like metal-binding protein
MSTSMAGRGIKTLPLAPRESNMTQWMQWDERFDIGVQEMNDQHKKLIDLMNELHILDEKKASKAEILKTLDALKNWTLRHFNEEEAYMASIAYPDLAVHKGTHAALIKNFLGYADEVANGDGSVPPKFFQFLKFWLASHICGIDTKYAAYSKTKKVA